jgi:hypothetical protein
MRRRSIFAPVDAEADMATDVRLAEVASIPLAVIRRQALQSDLARLVPQDCGTVWNVLKAHGITGAGRHVALYWEDRKSVV